MSISNWRILAFLALSTVVVSAVACDAKTSRGGGDDDDCEEDSDCDDGEVCDDGECVEGSGPGSGGGAGVGGSGGVPSSSNTGPGPGPSSSSGMGPTSSSQMSSSSSGSPPPPPGCDGEPTFDLCADCYVNEDPIGYEAFASALVLSCGCSAGAPCLSSCDDPTMDACPSPGTVDLGSASQACVDCINTLSGQESCLMNDFSANCQSDPNCVDFVTKLQNCPPP